MGIRTGAAGAFVALCTLVLAACSGGGANSGGSTPPDTTPDAFSFTAVTGAAPSTAVTSNAVTINGITAAAPVGISGGEYSVGCGATFTASAATISNHQTVCVRLTSAAAFGTAAHATLTVGGVSAQFSVTTAAADTTPDAFSFTDMSGVPVSTVETSNAVTISGINTAAPVSVAGGLYSVGCTANFTGAAGTIANGQSVCVRHTSAGAHSTKTTTTLTVGGVSASFSSTTGAADTTPDAFSFAPAANVPFGTVQTSAAATISGIDTAAAVTVSGGQYSIGCTAAFTSAAGTIGNGQTVCLRHTSAVVRNTAVTTTLTVGGVQGSFTSTTDNAFLLPYVNGNGQVYAYLARTGESRLIDSGVGDSDNFQFLNARLLLSTTIDPSAGRASELRPESLVYAKGGKLYRVKLDAGAGNQPVQVSSYTDVCNVSVVLRDFATPDQSWIVLTRAATPTDCSQPAGPPTLVRASASASATGITLQHNDGSNTSIAAVHDVSGHIASVLAGEDAPTPKLRRYDANLQSPKDLVALNFEQLPLMRELWGKGMYVGTTSPTTAGYVLVRYDEATQTVTAVHTFPTTMSGAAALDQNYIYMGDTNELIRIPHNATNAFSGAVVATVPNPDGGILITVPSLTADNHVAFSVYDTAGSVVNAGVWCIAANANNGTPVRLLNRAKTDLVMIAGNRIYLNYTDDTVNQPVAAAVNPDGSGATLVMNSTWSRRTRPQSFDLYPGGVPPYATPYDQQGTLGASFLLRSDTVSGGFALKAVDPASGAVTASLGTVNASPASINVAGFANLGLVDVYGSVSGGSFQYDTYGVDFATAGSLKALNNTSGDDQSIFQY